MDFTRSRMILELLTKTLEFYGAGENYEVVEGGDFSPIEADSGVKARETLRNIRELMKDESTNE